MPAIVALVVASTPVSAAPRFFASTAQCESARILPPGGCRTAFANALAEYAAKAPTYRSRRVCFRAFGPCMPWPIGTRRFDAFRPQWVGANVDLASVTPAVAPGRVPLDFAPQSVASLSPQAETPRAAPADAGPAGSEARILTPDDDGGDAGPAPKAPPGSGFTVIDGVLTYPAPARFQPKALKHP